jgi:hypothetical protein
MYSDFSPFKWSCLLWLILVVILGNRFTQTVHASVKALIAGPIELALWSWCAKETILQKKKKKNLVLDHSLVSCILSEIPQEASAVRYSYNLFYYITKCIVNGQSWKRELILNMIRSLSFCTRKRGCSVWQGRWSEAQVPFWTLECIWDCDFVDNKCDFKSNHRI